MTKLIEQVKSFDGKQNNKFNRGMIESLIAMKTGCNIKLKNDAYNEISIYDDYVLSIWTIEEELEIF